MDEKILASVCGWLARGASDDQARAAISEALPNSNPDEILSAALQRLRDQGVIDSTYTRGWAATAYKALINKMLEIGDLDGARKAVDNVVRLAASQPAATKALSDMDKLLEWGDQHAAKIDDADK